MDPSEAFSLVASEPRFEVLQTLWDLTQAGDERAVSFATLRKETGIRDSGQFNYHLDQLTPQFVRKIDDGYHLTVAGRRIVGAAVSGVYTDLETAMEPQAVGECHDCGGVIEAGYEHGHMSVACRECGQLASHLPAPPVLVATHDPEELPTVLSKHLLTEVQRLNRGFCTYCGGTLDAAVLPRDRDGFPGDWNVEFDCRVCGSQSTSVVTAVVIDHPTVLAFLDDAGFDVRKTPVWEIDPIFSATETVVSEDPVQVETTLETDGATLTLTVDEDLNVVGYERRCDSREPES